MDGLFSIAYAARPQTDGLSMGGDLNIATVTPAVRVFLTHIICSLQLSAALHDTLATQCCKSVALFSNDNKHWTEMTSFWWRDTSEVLLSLSCGWFRSGKTCLYVCLSFFLYVGLKRSKRFARTLLIALTFLLYGKHFQWHRGIWSQNLTSNIAPTSPPRHAQTHHHCQLFHTIVLTINTSRMTRKSQYFLLFFW